MARPVPYKGNESYIFISYAHRDAERVLPMVEQMQQDGFRVWYDEGIDPGTEWDENIASHLADCAFFLPFLSENYLRSENCKDELNYARDLKKPLVLVYLEPVKLPRGMELRVGRCPSFRWDRNGGFLGKLYKEDGIKPCREKTVRKNSGGIWRLVIPAVLVAVVGFGAFLMTGDRQEETDPTENTVPTESGAIEATEPDTMPETVLMDQEGVTVTVHGVSVSPEGALSVSVTAKNESGEDGTLFLGPCSVNGVFFSRYFCPEIASGEEMEWEFTWTAEEVKAAGLTDIRSASDVKVIEGIVHFQYYKDRVFFQYFPQGEEQGQLPAYIMDADDQVLVSKAGIQLILTDQFYDETNQWVSEYVVKNGQNRQMDLEIILDEINQYKLHYSQNCSLGPGSWTKVRLFANEWQDTDQEGVLRASGSLNAYVYGQYDVAQEEFVFFPGGDEDLVLGPRQLTQEDLILLENEYLRVAIVGTFSSGEKYAYRLYCQNISNRQVTAQLGGVGEDGIDYLLAGDELKPGEQLIETIWSYTYIEEKPETISFDVECYDINSKLIFMETVEFSPEW